ncbi:glycosyltransferase [Polynucleobacter alcilacus]|uniref:glycosyltransferase n=1 Tax=Polynucleobacter alcilacus TaxID=1819739 RepID=UPI001C0CA4C1|nr:glycosyltransferase [Polynucleobacter alcilacus]MBU3568190.1 hypothetical protein [Polynucleobacter alcilacus]
MKNKISIYLEVYNEAHRLQKCLSSFQWADQIVIFVKKSDDDTLEIAKQFATHVYEVDYCDGNENLISNINSHTWNEWILFCTASSAMDDSLVPMVVEKTSGEFEYDAIGLPYKMTVFGLSNKCSPWGAKYKYGLIRKASLVVSSKLHQEFSWTGDRIGVIEVQSTDGRFHHNTHQNLDEFFSKHLRYISLESDQFISEHGDKAYRYALVDFLRSIAFVSIKRRSIYRGRDGFVMSLAYVSYFFNRLLSVWFKLRSNKNI